MEDDRKQALVARYQARLDFDEALRLLNNCARTLRGRHVTATPAAMQTEIAVSKAIDALHGNGFKL